MKTTLPLLAFLVFSTLAFSQRGKNGSPTITGAAVQVNAYTTLTADAAPGASSLTVASNLLNANFSSNLIAGDLIMIYQAQGATLNGLLNVDVGLPNSAAWGDVTNYNNAGNYEFVEVLGVAGTTTINLTCGVLNGYTSDDHVQIIRVPRYDNLTVATAASVTCPPWDGSTGGVVSVEVKNTTTINGTIDVTGTGFRGGELDASSGWNQWYSSTNPGYGGEKGEGIGGYKADYTPLGGMYARGAAANSGGGGNSQNAGGGGGANGGNTAKWYDGFGNADPAFFSNAWPLDPLWNPALATDSACGGGRGGYVFSDTDQDALTVAPGDVSWGGGVRYQYGGLGGRPLDYSTGKLFLGGGGGAGDQDDGDGGAGSAGGGMIYLLTTGNVTGTGSCIADGLDGGNTDPSNPGFSYAGDDGAGGAGGGGTIILNSTGTVSLAAAQANGGTGGNALLDWFIAPDVAYGPGGGGGGGYIAVSNGNPTRTTNGGVNGTTNAPALTEFPPNGATGGGCGTPDATINNWMATASDTGVCAAISIDLVASLSGTPPVGTSVVWYDAPIGGTLLYTGSTYTVAPSITTTYYVGSCPGHYLSPVVVTVSPVIVIDDSGIILGNETCNNTNGTITGITASGGTSTLTYEWNGVASPSINLNNAGAGPFTLTVSDAINCSASSGPYALVNEGESTSSSFSETACNSYTVPSGDETYMNSVTVTDTVLNMLGCDSVMTINITINTVDTSVTPSGMTLNADATGAAYQWLDCDSDMDPVSGEINQLFTIPDFGGNYAVEVTENGCTDTSSCYTLLNDGLYETFESSNILVFPNPATDKLVVQLTATASMIKATIFNNLGATVLISELKNSNNIELNLQQLPVGPYYVRVAVDDKIQFFKVVKQ